MRENHGKWIGNDLNMWIQTNINFSNSKSHTSSCIGRAKTVFLVAAVVPWPQIMVPRRKKGDQGLLVSLFLDLFYYQIIGSTWIKNNYLNHKKNLSNKARFNLNNRNYSMDAIKTHRSTQTTYWALGLGPNPRAIAP